MTLRRESEALRGQLAALGLRRHFSGVFSGWAEGDRGAELKASWMRSLAVPGRSALVGDSEIDMEAARRAGLRAVGVSFGIRGAAELRSLGADAVVDRLGDLAGVLGACDTVR